MCSCVNISSTMNALERIHLEDRISNRLHFVNFWNIPLASVP